MIIQEVQPRKPYPLKEGVETVLRNIESTVPKAKTAKAEDLVDDSVFRKLDAERFHRRFVPVSDAVYGIHYNPTNI